MKIRVMSYVDYMKITNLWDGLAQVCNDSENFERNVREFFNKNPNTSFVAVENNQIIGTIITGYDGYTGIIHYIAILEQYKKFNIGEQLVGHSLEALQIYGINEVLVVTEKNMGNIFWKKMGFTSRYNLIYCNLQ